MNNKTKDILIVGLALFAMFFGAGNLIFPPKLGLTAGKDWIICGLGFFATAIGMPLLGIIAVSKAGGSIDKIGNKVSPLFSKIFGTIVILAIGPLLAIPRTGATAFELGFKQIFPNAGIIISVIFFGITLLFVLKPSKIVDRIGKILTPLLLIMIITIIIKGFISPLGQPETVMSDSPFATGFTEGYQTMDALASLVFGGVILLSVISKGYVNIKEQVNITVKAGFIAAALLAIIYGGLTYLGACTNTIYPSNIEKSVLLIQITNNLLGDFGKIALGIVAFLACLTTSIGLTATVGDFFNKLSNKKISYNFIVITTSIFSCIFANVGVEKIVNIAVPLLSAVYPVAIVLILLNLVAEYIPNKFYPGAVIGAMVISLYDGIKAAGFKINFITNLFNKIPLYDAGFGWVFPAIIGGLLTLIIMRNKKTV